MVTSTTIASATDGTASHQFEAMSTPDKPRPSVLRRPTVQFDEVNDAAHRYLDENYRAPPRTGTLDSEASRASSKVEERWRKQTILSLDGGGIRGYSSLLILKEIMIAVERIEKEMSSDSTSSFYPEQYVPPHNNKRKPSSAVSEKREHGGTDKACRFLPCHYFDYIGGTSTGGLIAIMLGRLRMGIDQCLEEYENFGGDIFGHPRWFSMRGPLPSLKEKYDGKRLQDAVEAVVQNRSSPQQKAVGAGYFGSAKDLCKTIVVSYLWNNDSSSKYGDELADGMALPHTARACPTESGAYLFRSYDHWGTLSKDGCRNVLERNPGPADNIPIWEVARATTAAPTYFDPIEIQGIPFGDGGLGSNNPVQEIFDEVAGMHGNTSSVVDVLVSIGTGQADPVKLHTSGVKKILSYLNATKALATDSEEQHLRMLRSIKRFGVKTLHYKRFNLPREQGLKNMKLDEWKLAGELELTKHGIKRRKESTLDKIRRLTLGYCGKEEVINSINEVAQRLVDHRRARCEDVRKWELWATGVRYRCTVDECDKSQKLRPSKNDLQYHIEKVHPILLRGKAPDQRRTILEETISEGICHY